MKGCKDLITTFRQSVKCWEDLVPWTKPERESESSWYEVHLLELPSVSQIWTSLHCGVVLDTTTILLRTKPNIARVKGEPNKLPRCLSQASVQIRDTFSKSKWINYNCNYGLFIWSSRRAITRQSYYFNSLNYSNGPSRIKYFIGLAPGPRSYVLFFRFRLKLNQKLNSFLIVIFCLMKRNFFFWSHKKDEKMFFLLHWLLSVSHFAHGVVDR